MGGLPADARPFDDPILLPGGRELVTLRDAAAKSSFASPRAATRNASSGNGRCRPSPHPMARASIRVFLLAGQDHRQRRAVASHRRLCKRTVLRDPKAGRDQAIARR